MAKWEEHKFIYYQVKKDSVKNYHHFLFCVSYLLGLTGALQGILTPDFTNINNFTAVLSGHLQHSLIHGFQVYLYKPLHVFALGHEVY